jgi:hypothetical protein
MRYRSDGFGDQLHATIVRVFEQASRRAGIAERVLRCLDSSQPPFRINTHCTCVPHGP